MILPYSDCLWKGSVVNFHESHKAREGEWKKIKPTTLTQHKVLAAHFKEEVDLSGALRYAAMEKEHSMASNLLSQLAGTLEAQGVDDIGDLASAAKQVGQIP